MTEQANELVARMARMTDASGSESLWWRPSLGQATFELLSAGKPVTIETLIAQLKAGARPDDLVHRTLSAKAAIRVLESLAEEQAGREEAPHVQAPQA